VKGPDFLGVGAARSGTSWLYAVLERHPALWLPPVKELHYFDNPRHNKRDFASLKTRVLEGIGAGRPLSLWDVRYFLGRRSDDWYCRLFEPGRRRGLVTGEITPAYSVLDEPQLGRIRTLNPDVKLIFSMRDPVLRTWSSIMKKTAKKRGSVPAVDLVLRHAGDGALKRASYCAIIDRLERVFGRDQIFWMFFDEQLERPIPLLTRLLTFLGVEPGDVEPLLPKGPVNAAARGRTPPADLERALAAAFLPDVRKLCERFDGPPHAWRARYETLLA
jgi:hypothetical protein